MLLPCADCLFGILLEDGWHLLLAFAGGKGSAQADAEMVSNGDWLSLCTSGGTSEGPILQG